MLELLSMRSSITDFPPGLIEKLPQDYLSSRLPGLSRGWLWDGILGLAFHASLGSPCSLRPLPSCFVLVKCITRQYPEKSYMYVEETLFQIIALSGKVFIYSPDLTDNMAE